MTGPEPAVPPQAITAGTDAVMAQRNLKSEGSRDWARRIVMAALEAAAPHLAAAERERCAQLADKVRAVYWHPRHFGTGLPIQSAEPFADLLRQGGEGGAP